MAGERHNVKTMTLLMAKETHRWRVDSFQKYIGDLKMIKSLARKLIVLGSFISVRLSLRRVFGDERGLIEKIGTL
jgi:hypothetical protein